MLSWDLSFLKQKAKCLKKRKERRKQTSWEHQGVQCFAFSPPGFLLNAVFFLKLSLKT